MLQLLAMLAQQDDCPSSTPTISSVTNTDNTYAACPTGWTAEFTATLAGSLQPDQEMYWEKATNAAGDNWTFAQRGGLTLDLNAPIGAGGTGGSATYYFKVRAYVVPTGGNSSNACEGPTTSSQVSRTDDSCVE